MKSRQITTLLLLAITLVAIFTFFLLTGESNLTSVDTNPERTEPLSDKEQALAFLARGRAMIASARTKGTNLTRDEIQDLGDFCLGCGSYLWDEATKDPEMKAIKAETLSLWTQAKAILKPDITYTPARRFPTRKEIVGEVCFSPDGKHALGATKSLIDYWNLETGTIHRTLKGHIGGITTVTISPDGKFALSGGYDKNLIYWNLQTGQLVRHLTQNTHKIGAATISPDGNFALSGCNNTVKYWNLTTGKCLHSLTGHTRFIRAVAISADGNYALSGSEDDTVKYWNLRTGECIRTLTGHTKSIYTVAISPDGKTALSGGQSQPLRYWDLTTGKCVRTIDAHHYDTIMVAFGPNDQYAMSACDSDKMKYWNLKTGQCIHTINITECPGFYSTISCAALSADGKHILTGSYKVMQLWSLAPRTGQ